MDQSGNESLQTLPVSFWRTQRIQRNHTSTSQWKPHGWAEALFYSKKGASTHREIVPERTHERTAYKSVDYFNCTVIGNKIQEFYTFRRQLPTIRSLHKVLCDDIDFLGSTTSLRKIIKRLGFFWKKTRDNRKVLMERPNVVPLRLVFYDRTKHLEDSGHQLVSTRPGSIPPIRPNPVSKVQWFSIK